MKKFEFKIKYENWNLCQGHAKISEIRLIDEFESMIKSGLDAFDWVSELLTQQPTWILIIILNGLYDENKIEPPTIPFDIKGKLKDITKVHLEYLKKIKEN